MEEENTQSGPKLALSGGSRLSQSRSKFVLLVVNLITSSRVPSTKRCLYSDEEGNGKPHHYNPKLNHMADTKKERKEALSARQI